MVSSFQLLVSFLALRMPLALALVPRAFWIARHRKAMTTNTRRRTTPKAQWNMYFDDCERLCDVEKWKTWLPTGLGGATGSGDKWIKSRSEDKKQAMEHLLGYNAMSAASLTEEQVETETLQWALDCNIIWGGDYGTDEDDGYSVQVATTNTSMYSSLSDLIIASDCKNTVDCLAFIWSLIAKLLDFQEFNAVYMVVFPNATTMWEYDVMVTALQALTVSKPLLPPNMQLDLDLFHPDYKHSPRMWSPETHSPFPTLGVSIRRQKTFRSPATPSLKSSPREERSLEDELEDARSRLEALFQSLDADDRGDARSLERNIDTANVLEECKSWAHSSFSPTRTTTSTDLEWLVDPHVEPFQLYARLWSVIQGLQSDTGRYNNSTVILIAPNLDAHTTTRIAITVNAALQRLQSHVCVVNVFHPNFPSCNPRHAPHAMIQLMRTTTVHRTPQLPAQR